MEKVSVIKKGTVLLTTKPFAYVLCPKLTGVRCDHCFKSGKLLKCSGCNYVYYCSRNCQKESWSIHRLECVNLKRISPKVVPNFARLMARVIIKLNQGGDKEVGYYTDTACRKFKDLMSHYSDIKKDIERMDHFVCICNVLYGYLENVPMPNSADLLGIYGRICINAFDILNEEFISIGTGIYLGPSVIDHSCKPNATAVFDGTTISIRTVKDIPYMDWSQIRISYIDLLKSTSDRRIQLQKQYYFWCKCEKCEETDITSEAAACPNMECISPCSSDDEKCITCNTRFPKDFRDTFNEINEFTAYHLESMKDMDYLDLSRVCLKKQEGILHPLNLRHVQTLQAALSAALEVKNYEDAEYYGRLLIPGHLLYYGELYPLTGLLYLTIGKVQLFLGMVKSALDTLQNASKILTITNGDGHPIVQDYLKPLLHRAMMEERNFNLFFRFLVKLAITCDI
ncbi:hypothetical protein KM043_001654 [Ampulex compressa]|nr:hypothetical protein KM043_001654 [Ampulex compressa]